MIEGICNLARTQPNILYGTNSDNLSFILELNLIVKKLLNDIELLAFRGKLNLDNFTKIL